MRLFNTRFHSMVIAGCSALACLGLVTSGQGQEATSKSGKAAAESPFGMDRIWQVHITIPPGEYAAMQPRGGGGPFGPPPEPLAPLEQGREVHRNNFGADLPVAYGKIEIGGRVFDKVALRYKGNGTIGDTMGTIKKSFKVDLDRFQDGASFLGQKTLNLHCDATDPTRKRETMGYALYSAAGVPSPRTAWAEVWLTVPGKFERQLLGMYTLLEQVDKSFLRKHFGNDRGLLMKPEGLRDFVHQGDEWDRYKGNYRPKREAKPDEAKRIIAFAHLVDQADDETFRREINQFLDVDNYLRFLATTAFIANTDSFFGLGHNYYLYLNPANNKLSFLPWDLDRAFANFGAPDQNMDLSLKHPYGGSHRLTERLLAVPEVSARYQELLKELVAGPYDQQRFLKELEALSKVTGGLLERDTKAAVERKEERRGGFGPFGQPPALETFIEKRTESVKAQLAGTSVGFIPQGGPFGPPPEAFGRLGDILPPLMQDQFGLSPEQRKKVAVLQKEADAELDKLLTEDQRKQLKMMRERGPFGGPGGPRGPGGPPRGPFGGPPGGEPFGRPFRRPGD